MIGPYRCDLNKATLIKSGMAKDKEWQLSDGTKLELAIKEDFLSFFLNWDETDHSFSTQIDKGGSWYIWLRRNNLQMYLSKALKVSNTQQEFMELRNQVK